MKSDLLCQEASASSPAAPSGGNGENNPRKSTFLGKQPPRVLRRCLGGFPEAAGHRACRGERRTAAGDPGSHGALLGQRSPGLPRTGLLHAEENKCRVVFLGRRPGGFFSPCPLPTSPRSAESPPKRASLRIQPRPAEGL